MSGTLHIDWTRCDGRGLCTELLPKLLARDDWGYPVPRSSSANRSDVPIGPDSAEAAKEAVQLCPKLALSIAVRRPSSGR
ncbi:ferredoxin [Arthrobacter sp. PAMC25564]|uniref:ferredoxin n=1 Tax=Arthrobacter sp. PAMC25564 TaxID=2565366 RepID=UPI0010A20CFC|nr:ferredoxin [Arthrobacter sp. PAMC25564]QCB96347.1 ferredoxin [Arthrobacter sp. PAMC25564]